MKGCDEGNWQHRRNCAASSETIFAATWHVQTCIADAGVKGFGSIWRDDGGHRTYFRRSNLLVDRCSSPNPASEAAVEVWLPTLEGLDSSLVFCTQIVRSVPSVSTVASLVVILSAPIVDFVEEGFRLLLSHWRSRRISPVITLVALVPVGHSSHWRLFPESNLRSIKTNLRKSSPHMAEASMSY